MRSIGIVIDVSAAVGMGHLTRSSVLAHSLATQLEVSVYLLGELSQHVYQVVASLLTDLKWQCVNLLTHTTHLPTDESPARGTALPSQSCRDAKENTMSVDAHSIWLIDLSASSQEHFAQSFAPIVERALALDWFLPEHRPAMTISLLDHGNVMGDAYARHAADTTAVPQLYAGADFAILKPQILDLARPGEIPQKKDALTTSESADSAVSVLLTFGGSDPSGCTLSAAKMLVPLSRHIDVVTIVLGALNETERSSVNELLGNIPHQIVCNPDDFEQRLAYADVVLCGGGGTLLEAMYLGRPCIVFAQSPEEKAHAALYVSVSACVWPDRLADVLACAKLRSSLSYSAAQQVDGRGVDRIRSKLMELS